MHILMFGWEFPPIISGGLGTACYGMTKSLGNSGESILFVLPKADERMPREGYDILSGADVYSQCEDANALPGEITVMPIESLLIPYIENKQYSQMLQQLKDSDVGGHAKSGSLMDFSGQYSENLFAEVSKFAEIGRHIGRKNHFDVIHAHDWMTFPAAIAAKQSSGKPMVTHVHATELDRTGDHPNKAIYSIEKAGMAAADRIIAVSQRTKKTLIERYGIEADKIDVVLNAVFHDRLVDPLTVKKGFREKLVIFVGRITLQKGPDYFLQAAAMLLKKDPDYRFVMAGAGDMLPRMIEKAAELRIQHRFHFTGFLKGPVLDRLYAMADLFVMTSVSEPFGLTPFEAMRYDVPVIVSKQTGAAELLPRSAQFDFWDRDMLIDMMIEFCENSCLRESTIESQKKILLDMSWLKVAEQLKLIYRGLLVA